MQDEVARTDTVTFEIDAATRVFLCKQVYVRTCDKIKRLQRRINNAKTAAHGADMHSPASDRYVALLREYKTALHEQADAINNLTRAMTATGV